jgi:hypothetical protein
MVNVQMTAARSKCEAPFAWCAVGQRPVRITSTAGSQTVGAPSLRWHALCHGLSKAQPFPIASHPNGADFDHVQQ